MIFPVLKGFVSPILAPVTYLLFALNLLVFVATFDEADEMDHRLDAVLTDRSFIETQGSAFAVMIKSEPKTFSATLARLADKALAGEMDSRRILGNLAIRNSEFMNRAETYDFGGDEVALKAWRQRFHELHEIQADHPSFQWGLSRSHRGWMQYVSYSFSHSGALHLFWNMIFLLIFGSFVETTLGSSFVIFTYLGAGVTGAFVFSHLSGISSSPLVGASAAVSGLMSLVGFGWLRREKVRFFYWLLPLDGYFGLVSLPSWLVIIVSLVPDLSGYLAASHEFGSVAYAAHLGGAAWGIVMTGAIAVGLLKEEVEEDETPEEYRRTG